VLLDDGAPPDTLGKPDEYFLSPTAAHGLADLNPEWPFGDGEAAVTPTPLVMVVRRRVEGRPERGDRLRDRSGGGAGVLQCVEHEAAVGDALVAHRGEGDAGGAQVPA